jgi:YesN/AraC family two-component response regulator
MFEKRFGNQSSEQIAKHLLSLLEKDLKYNLSVDSLGVRFTIEEARGISKSERRKINSEQPKRHRIRNAKKGHTVNLKGRENF